MTTSAYHPSAMRPPVGEAEQASGYVGEVTHGVLHRRELTAAQAVGQPCRGVGRPGHAVEMGAGIGATDHHVGVLPGGGAKPPGLGVVVGREWPTTQCGGRR